MQQRLETDEKQHRRSHFASVTIGLCQIKSRKPTFRTNQKWEVNSRNIFTRYHSAKSVQSSFPCMTAENNPNMGPLAEKLAL